MSEYERFLAVISELASDEVLGITLDKYAMEAIAGAITSEATDMVTEALAAMQAKIEEAFLV